jgi:hypothetical protein
VRAAILPGVESGIPALPADMVAILASTGEAGPVAIPVSAVHRRDPRCLLLALSRRRETVGRLRRDPRASLSLNGPGLSLCVAGEAHVVADPLPGADFMIAFAVAVDRVWDARGPATDIDAGIRWHWTDPEAGRRHAMVLRALEQLTLRD